MNLRQYIKKTILQDAASKPNPDPNHIWDQLEKQLDKEDDKKKRRMVLFLTFSALLALGGLTFFLGVFLGNETTIEPVEFEKKSSAIKKQEDNLAHNLKTESSIKKKASENNNDISLLNSKEQNANKKELKPTGFNQLEGFISQTKDRSIKNSTNTIEAKSKTNQNQTEINLENRRKVENEELAQSEDSLSEIQTSKKSTQKNNNLSKIFLSENRSNEIKDTSIMSIMSIASFDSASNQYDEKSNKNNTLSTYCKSAPLLPSISQLIESQKTEVSGLPPILNLYEDKINPKKKESAKIGLHIGFVANEFSTIKTSNTKNPWLGNALRNIRLGLSYELPLFNGTSLNTEVSFYHLSMRHIVNEQYRFSSKERYLEVKYAPNLELSVTAKRKITRLLFVEVGAFYSYTLPFLTVDESFCFDCNTDEIKMVELGTKQYELRDFDVLRRHNLGFTGGIGFRLKKHTLGARVSRGITDFTKPLSGNSDIDNKFTYMNLYFKLRLR